jgi:hypothetical protein
MLVVCPMHRSGMGRSIDRQKRGKAFAGIPLMVRRDERKTENAAVAVTPKPVAKLSWKLRKTRIDPSV